MRISFDDEYAALQAAIIQALRDWFNSLSPVEAETKCMSVSSVEYTPSEILEAVENGTDFGKKFLNGLCELQIRMVSNNSPHSITDLIRKSIIFSNDASATAGASN